MINKIKNIFKKRRCHHSKKYKSKRNKTESKLHKNEAGNKNGTDKNNDSQDKADLKQLEEILEGS